MADQGEVTRILEDVTGGDTSAVDRLLPLVYDELRRLAQSYLVGERPDHTLQATALVHEAYLRLVGAKQVDWRNRAHFFAVAARAMRRVLVDHARSHRRDKRGGGQPTIALDEALGVPGAASHDVIELHMALDKLDQREPEKAQVVEMRYFAGLTIEEVASVLGLTSRTVDRYWRYGRAWLYRELADGSQGSG